MQPHEIKPDTGLCTILGYNAQTGYGRKYFNAILKENHLNATAIALNITDEHFEFTMQSVGESKVDKMIIEREFQERVVGYCDYLNSDAKRFGYVDFIEVTDGRVEGYSLDSEVEKLFDNPEFLDDQIRFVTKMMLIANRWYGATIEVDTIPLLIEKKKDKMEKMI
ncbi:MAG: hypothetical protein U9R27_12725 [Campylobacterota bacterium]|nr:hypothetical protein [Campylobacterota bacterium]